MWSVVMQTTYWALTQLLQFPQVQLLSSLSVSCCKQGKLSVDEPKASPSANQHTEAHQVHITDAEITSQEESELFSVNWVN